MSACPFCAIVARKAPATIVKEWERAIAIVPLNPVTPGHVLVLPKEHVESATVNPLLTGMTMVAASELAQQPCNIITSVGAEATQTVRHLHIHIVPRRAGDGLLLPWSKTPDTLAADCLSCEEGTADNECPKSKRPCGHHCNHVWTHDGCDWCGWEAESGSPGGGEPQDTTVPAGTDCEAPDPDGITYGCRRPPGHDGSHQGYYREDGRPLYWRKRDAPPGCRR